MHTCSPSSQSARQRRALRRLAVATVVAVVSAGAATGVAEARPAPPRTASCVDRSGVLWTAKAVWDASYFAGGAGSGVAYVAWTTNRPGMVPTDSWVQTYDQAGGAIRTLAWTGRFDYHGGRTGKVRVGLNRPGDPRATAVRVTLGVDGDGRGNCTMMFDRPTPYPAPNPGPTPSTASPSTTSPSVSPSEGPSVSPSKSPKPGPSVSPSKSPAPGPSVSPSKSPTPGPSASVSPKPSPSASASPTPSPSPSARPKPPSGPQTLRHLPGQPAITAYGSSSAATPFAREGALIVAGRTNYADKPMKDASAAGATVLIYVDPIIDNAYGRYHEMLHKQSECGPATTRWPGSPKANSWGFLNDFREGSVTQRKFECVLEKMVAENPHMGGFFADDLGSRSWFTGFEWNSWGSGNQQAYRDGAIALARTLHKVAVKHRLVVMVNGTWTAGSVAANGGGYPDPKVHGLGLADGGYIEHHSASQIKFWTQYARGQWGTADGRVARGKPFMYVQAADAATRDAYNRAGAFSFLSAQTSYDTASMWGRSYSTGLPARVGTP